MANITEMAKGKFATTAKINFTEDYRFGREEDDFRNVNAKCGIFTAKIKNAYYVFLRSTSISGFFHIYDLSITQTWNTFLNPFRYISQNQQAQKTTTSTTTRYYLFLSRPPPKWKLYQKE